MTPGNGEIIIAPVSVCPPGVHYRAAVPPMTRRYHIHASGLIGSPTLPRSRGPLANGVTQVMYEGTPDTGGRDRWWSIVEQYPVSILYTGRRPSVPSLKWGEDLLAARDLNSLPTSAVNE